MNILLIGNCVQEHDLFQLALKRIGSGIHFFGAFTCEQALSNILDKTIPVPDYIFLDTDECITDVSGCREMLNGSINEALTQIILYSASEETARIRRKRGPEKLRLYKSYSFALFCQDLSLLLAEE